MNKLLETWNCIPETYNEVSKRYSGFGANLFSTLQHNQPYIFNNLKFFRSIDLSTDDVLAIFESEEYNFGIQLAVVSEVIVLWNENRHIEIGSWSHDQVEEAIRLIKTDFCH